MAPSVDPPPANLRRISEAVSGKPVTARTVRRWVASGRVRGYRVGPRLIMVDPAEVAETIRPIRCGTGGAT